MKSELRNIIGKIKPKIFGVDNIKIDSFKKLGVGEGNLNYVFKLNSKKYLCRVNIESEKSDKLKQEFETLQKIKKYDFSPKPIYFQDNPEFSILKFIEGKPFRHGKRSYSKRQITKIAEILAKLHSVNIKIKPSNYKFGYYTNGARHLMEDLNKRTKNEFKKELLDTYEEVLKQIPLTETHKFALIHGDICPQNIVETEDSVRLIDWENVVVSDPARDLAQVLIDLGLQKEDLKHFLRTYSKFRTDENILERARIYAILMRQNYYIWEVIRALEIKNKELPKEYMQKTNVKEHLREANKQQRNLYKLLGKNKTNIDFLELL